MLRHSLIARNDVGAMRVSHGRTRVRIHKVEDRSKSNCVVHVELAEDHEGCNPHALENHSESG